MKSRLQIVIIEQGEQIFFVFVYICIGDQQKFMFSKETIDKVRLAKQYIENRYQSILVEQKKNQQNWQKISSLLDPMRDNVDQIKQAIWEKQAINKRLERQKDTLDNYRLYNVIGKGAFGEVRLAKNIVTNDVVAIKRLDKRNLLKKKQIYNAYLERDFMIKNKSQFIVQLKSTFQDNDYLYIVMEYVQGGDLLHLLIEKDILSEDETRFYIAELILALQQIHKSNFVHRDVKPDNILIDKNGHIKISDFGLSKYLENEENQKRKNMVLTKMEKLKKLSHIKNKQRVFSKVGTPDYISPEVLTEKTYSHSVDLWGVGVIMFECLYGFPPFTDEDSKEVCHKVAHWVDYLEFPSEIQVSTCAKMLMLGLMDHSQKRLTIKQIKDHAFFQSINWQTLHKMKAPIVPKIKNDLDTSNFDEFEITNPWTKIQKQLLLNLITSKSIMQSDKQETGNVTVVEEECIDLLSMSMHERKTTAPRFRFPGFDYKRVDNDPLEIVVSRLTRKSCSQPKSMKRILGNFSKIVANKRLKTEMYCEKTTKQESNRLSMKKRLGKVKKDTEKTRPSELGTTVNNISLNIGRLSTPKELNKIFQQEASSNKENQERKTVKSPISNKKIKEADKLKQIYSCLGKKIASKKNEAQSNTVV